MTISNLPSGGNIGTAASTVDIYTIFNVNQTQSGQTITLPDPSDLTPGRMVYVTNTGNTPFTILSTQLSPNSARSMIWDGNSWVLAGNADDKTVGLLRKAADETVVNNTIQNDDHLFFPVKTGETWMFQITAITQKALPSSGGMKVQMSVSGATNCSNTVSTNYQGAFATNATCNTPLTVPNLNNFATTLNSDSYIYVGVFKAGADGNAQFQWAQNTTNAA